jgi:hypothetical protein
MNKRLRNWIECYHTQPGYSVPSGMCSMQQRIYRLTKLLGQCLGSAQPISVWLLNGNLYPDQGFYNASMRWLSPKWDMLKLGSYSTIALKMLSAYQTRFHTNLIIFTSKHNHVLDMAILFPSSTPSTKVYSWLYQPSEIKNIISPLCDSYRIYSTS